MKKIYLIAGESSGDLYGASIIRALAGQDVAFYGVGGEKMQQAGFQSLFPMKELAMMGFLEILPHIPKLKRRIKETIAHIREVQPDVVLTIDSPGFNFRVAAQLQERDFRLIHMVAPTVWAYKPERAQKVKELYDHLLLILPFEKPYFDEVGLETTYIGHPITELVKPGDGETFRQQYGIGKNTPCLTMLPGSRHTEIQRLLPIFQQVILNLQTKISNLEIVIPSVAHSFDVLRDKLKTPQTLILPPNTNKYDAFAASNAALAKSGTGTLELALHHVPMVVCYKVHPLTYFMVKRMVKVNYINLLNLIEGSEMIPERIQHACNAEQLTADLLPLLTDKQAGTQQVTAYENALASLHVEGRDPSDMIANMLYSHLRG